jgi:hypothetical protein
MGKQYVQGETNGEVNCACEGKLHDFGPFFGFNGEGFCDAWSVELPGTSSGGSRQHGASRLR